MRGWLLGVGLAILAIAALLLWRATREQVHVEPVAGSAAPAPAPVPAAAPAPVAADAAVAAAPADAAASPAQAAAHEERVAAVTAMRSSGDAFETWANDGRRLISDLIVPGARASDIGCYVAGCVGVVTFDTEAAARAAIAELQASDPYKAWTGGKKITTAEVDPAGHTTVALVLSRPD